MTDQSTNKAQMSAYQTGLSSGYIDGQWAAYNEILFFLNTLQTKEVDKALLYHWVFNLRPKERKPNV